MRVFVDDDDAYRDWVDAHPAGYVVNANMPVNRRYLVLHDAGCSHVRRATAPAGHWTTHGYCKFCADDLEELRSFAQSLGRADGSFSKECAHCRGTK